MKAENVRVGQRVRVYDVTHNGHPVQVLGTVKSHVGVAVEVTGVVGPVHCSQLRLLKKKQPRALDDRRWWVNVYNNGPHTEMYTDRKDADTFASPGRIGIAELAIVARHPVGKGK